MTFSRNVVFPDPGLETRLTTNTPAVRNCSRRARAITSFCFKTFRRTSISRGPLILLPPMRTLPVPSPEALHLQVRRTQDIRTAAQTRACAWLCTVDRTPPPQPLRSAAAIAAVAGPDMRPHRKTATHPSQRQPVRPALDAQRSPEHCAVWLLPWRLQRFPSQWIARACPFTVGRVFPRVNSSSVTLFESKPRYQ